MKNLARIKNQNGQGLVEYALIIALVALAAIGVLQLLGGDVNNIFANIRAQLAGPAAAPAA